MALAYEGLNIHNLSQFKKACIQYGPLGLYCIKHIGIWTNDANWKQRDYKCVAKICLDPYKYLQ